MPSDYVVLRLQPGTSKVAVGSSGGGPTHETDGKPAAERTGTFVATPARSWQPMARKVEQAEREVWG